MGKKSATRYKKRLREIGIKNAWFGIIDGVIIASGASKQEVQRIMQEIAPADKQELVYIFQFKTK